MLYFLWVNLTNLCLFCIAVSATAGVAGSESLLLIVDTSSVIFSGSFSFSVSDNDWYNIAFVLVCVTLPFPPAVALTLPWLPLPPVSGLPPCLCKTSGFVLSSLGISTIFLDPSPASWSKRFTFLLPSEPLGLDTGVVSVRGSDFIPFSSPTFCGDLSYWFIGILLTRNTCHDFNFSTSSSLPSVNSSNDSSSLIALSSSSASSLVVELLNLPSHSSFFSSSLWEVSMALFFSNHDSHDFPSSASVVEIDCIAFSTSRLFFGFLPVCVSKSLSNLPESFLGILYLLCKAWSLRPVVLRYLSHVGEFQPSLVSSGEKFPYNSSPRETGRVVCPATLLLGTLVFFGSCWALCCSSLYARVWL